MIECSGCEEVCDQADRAAEPWLPIERPPAGQPRQRSPPGGTSGMRNLASGLILAGAALAACGDDDGGAATATATFMGVSGQAVAGTAKFTEDDDGGVRLVVTITA